ncbi:unnamed protein product [Rhizopus microsporus]
MHEKKRRRSNYVPESTVVNPPASWVTRATKISRSESVEETGTSSKRPFTAKDRDEFLMNGFMEQLEIRVSEDIHECYRANRSLNELHQNMLSRSRLPRGIVTNAESRIQLKAMEIDNFLKEKEETTPIQIVTKEIDSGEEAMEQYEPSVSVPEEMLISSFSTSLLSLLRLDLSVDIRDAFLYTIDQVMVSACVALKSATFINEGNNTVVLEEQNDVNVQEILPKDFPMQGNIVHFPPPLNKECTPTVALEKELANLFKSGHLQTIHAHHFGPRGVDIDKLTKYLFERVLFDALPKRDMMVDESIEPYLMKIALNKYMANFKTLWSNKFRYTRLLNRVITVLLRIYLAPKLERLKREKKNYGSGAQKLRLQLQRAKKANARRISSIENAASRKSIKKDESVARLEEWYQRTARHREQLRNFYYSPARKLQRPLRVTGNTKLKVVNGTFQCVNPDCSSVLAGKATHVRDSLSAMIIGLSGLATLLFGATFPQFDPKRSSSKTAEFEHLAATF